MALNSPRVPLLGIIIVWSFYVCFSLLRPSPEQEPAPPAAQKSPTASRAATGDTKVSRKPNRAPSLRRAKAHKEREDAQEKAPEAPTLSPEDKELLAILSKPFDEEVLAQLEALVEEYPEYPLGRAILALCLFALDAEGAAIRPHVEELRNLMPDYGLPDLLMAQLEMAEGNLERARAYLLEIAGKDLTWSPDGEIIRMRISSGLNSGESVYTVLSRAAGQSLSFGMFVAKTVRTIMHPEEGAGPGGDASSEAPVATQLRIEMARAVLELGGAMQEHGALLIENLIGCALVRAHVHELEETGALTAEEEALRTRAEALRGEARIIAHGADELLLTDPDRATSYLRNLAAHGELRAARRGLMDYLSAGMRGE